MAGLFQYIVNLLLHLDQHFGQVIQNYGNWTYAILFLVIFLETGLVVTPFLPGDSLLFTAGAFAALGSINMIWIIGWLTLAAIAGDTVNYWIGQKIGPRAFSGEKSRFFNKKHLIRTQRFYEKYGGKTIVLARFVPIIRSFAPFVAGIGSMSYRRFLSFNVIGGLGWVVSISFVGYFFGNIPFVRSHFSFVVFAIIIISVLPAITEVLRERGRA